MPSGDALERWTAAMLEGDFERAWQVTDCIEAARSSQPDGSRLLWDGTALEGRTALVRCCHGLGDTIQFARYLPMLRRIAKRVAVDVQPELRELFAGAALTATSGDVEIECMELPYAFRTMIDTIPACVPYLPIHAIRRARAGFQVYRRPGQVNAGVIWAAGEWNPRRSMRFSQLAPLAALDGIALHSLQQGPAREELKAAAFEVIPLSCRTGDIVTAAAAMLQLDLIITVDTVTAHLAGALGRPVWTLLPHEADWRWMRDRDDTPWYPTMRLFRQRAPGDWDEVVSRVACELAKAAPR